MEQLFGAIPGALGKLGPNAEISEAVVFAAWVRCAGLPLRKRTSPVEFFENRLVVAVEDKTWQRHLEELSPQMLFKINGSLGAGTVRFIEFRIDARAVRKARNDSAKSKMEGGATGDLAPSLIAAAGAITDNGLRKAFLGAARSYLDGQSKRAKK